MSDDRPNPLKEAASKAGAIWSGLAGVLGALASYGVLTSAQTDAITAAGEALSPTILALGVIVGGVIPLVGGVVAAFRTASVGRDHVTPIVDPRNNAGDPLVVVPSGPRHYAPGE